MRFRDARIATLMQHTNVRAKDFFVSFFFDMNIISNHHSLSHP